MTKLQSLSAEEIRRTLQRRKGLLRRRKAELDRLTSTAHHIGHRDWRFGFYVYLASVYELYVEWSQSNEGAISKMRDMADVLGTRVKSNTHPIRALIDVSSRMPD